MAGVNTGLKYCVRFIVLVAHMTAFFGGVVQSQNLADYDYIYFDQGDGAYVYKNPATGREAFFCQDYSACGSVGYILCPESCPTRESTAPGPTACTFDCVSCTIGCKHLKVNCTGSGNVCYDPRFIGGDGVMFYFHGQKDQNFCIVSDKTLHINARFIGKRPEGRSRDYTWVQGLGILFGSHKISILAKKVANWSDAIDQLILSFDGQDVILPELEGSRWTSPSGNVKIERTTNVNSVHLVIDQLMEVYLDVVPITKEESRVHNYQITKDDCFAHLNMQFNFFHVSTFVDGVLGQTYQPHFKNPVKVGVPMPIMGGDKKFWSSSLFSSDCKASQFSPITSIASNDDLIQSFPLQCNDVNGQGLTCRR